MYSLRFEYDSRGFGKLQLVGDGGVEVEHLARTGSVNHAGKLQNAIPTGMWYLLDNHKPQGTTEVAMMRTPGAGWKVRLYRLNTNINEYFYDGFLIHPDGNKPGSEGCIVTVQSDALDLKQEITRILKDEQDSIELYVGKPKE